MRLLRELIEQATPVSSMGAIRARDLERLSKRLYRVLVEPARGAVAASDRVLLVPDGPLHLLPFGALLRETSAASPDDARYLAEWKPLHTVLSATVYAELKKTRRSAPPASSGGPLLAAFGDPRYPRKITHGNPEDVADARLRSAARLGFLGELEPLPHSRREVEGIAALYPSDTAKTYLGRDATEERAKAVSRDTRMLHLAAHGRVDDRFPLNSWLALSLPEAPADGQDNGLLQVWEIFERVRLDADLVVLSACESGLGQEQGGDGLIGLTRAFQYAGARSVLASLWQVRDQATAELMVRFYRHLRSGLPKAEALRAAQLELIRGPVEIRPASGGRIDSSGKAEPGADGEPVTKDFSAPYYWAAFQLIGDWR